MSGFFASGNGTLKNGSLVPADRSSVSISKKSDLSPKLLVGKGSALCFASNKEPLGSLLLDLESCLGGAKPPGRSGVSFGDDFKNDFFSLSFFSSTIKYYVLMC